MDLPPCKTIEHDVGFTGIEKQLYQQVYRDCVKMIATKLGTRKIGSLAFDHKYTDLDYDVLRVIKTWMSHLLKLCISTTRVDYFFVTTKRSRKDHENET